MKPGRMLPVIFLTHDADTDVAITVVNSWARLWAGSPLHFLVPFQGEDQGDRFRDLLNERISIELVQCEKDLCHTLQVLCQRALRFRTADWFLWASSDRCPLAVGEWLKDAVERSSLPREASAVRLIRWKDSLEVDPGDCDAGSDTKLFSHGRMLFHGFWHPQLVARVFVEWLSSTAAAGPQDAGVRDWQPYLQREIENSGLTAAYPTRNLVLFDEPTIAGCPTISYAAKRAHLGRPLPPKTVLSPVLTGGFGNPAARNTNLFWEKKGTKLLAEDIPGWAFPDADIVVATFGGCGSKMVVNWLYQGSDATEKIPLHRHERIPPRAAPRGSVIYVFGDPRNTIVSFFERRNGFTANHGFANKLGTMDPAPPGNSGWCMTALSNLQADGEAMDEGWGLEEYLRYGVDLFRLQEHFNMWLHSPLPYPVFFLKYEHFWEVAPLVRRYLVADCGPVPSKRVRRADWTALSPYLRAALEQMYGLFAKHLESLPGFFLARDGSIIDLATGRQHKVYTF
jgi:hypothetical protein